MVTRSARQVLAPVDVRVHLVASVGWGTRRAYSRCGHLLPIAATSMTSQSHRAAVRVLSADVPGGFHHFW
jgi:hypothetical protein